MATPEKELNYGDDDAPFEVSEEVEVGDVSTQSGGDAIDPAKRRRFEIRKMSVRTYQAETESSWRKKFLALDLVLTEGVNDEGKYKGKHFFQDELLVANTQDFPELDTENYRTQGRFGIKSLFKALGYDPAKPPKINDEFITENTGKEVIADITRREIQTRPSEPGGKWVGTGEYKNEIKNYRAAE